MNPCHRFRHRATLALLLGLGVIAPALAQTNDPLVSQQRYLFDVHRIDRAWSVTTGSSNTSIGIYSMLGFIQSHEDLSSSRLLARQGDVLVPELDYASEMAGIVGATTNNSRGMAGIDRAARLQSYSILRSQRTGDKAERPVTFERTNGTSSTYYLDLRRFSEMLDRGRSNGIDVHLFSFGIPDGDAASYALPAPPDKRPGTLPDPDESTNPDNWPTQRKNFAQQVLKSLDSIFGSLCGDTRPPLSWLIGSCYSPPDPLDKFRSSIGNAVKGNGVVVAPAGDLNGTRQQPTPYLPGVLDKYALTVGGIRRNIGGDLVKWERTREASYVDVAGYAENVVGLSGSGANKYNRDFDGTAAAASIGAGVAGLLKAKNASLSGEDIEEILKRTARDADRDPGRDDATGYGAIDAEAALNFVRNNNVQRATRRGTTVNTPQAVGSKIRLVGYDNFVPR